MSGVKKKNILYACVRVGQHVTSNSMPCRQATVSHPMHHAFRHLRAPSRQASARRIMHAAPSQAPDPGARTLRSRLSHCSDFRAGAACGDGEPGVCEPPLAATASGPSASPCWPYVAQPSAGRPAAGGKRRRRALVTDGTCALYGALPSTHLHRVKIKEKKSALSLQPS